MQLVLFSAAWTKTEGFHFRPILTAFASSGLCSSDTSLFLSIAVINACKSCQNEEDPSVFVLFVEIGMARRFYKSSFHRKLAGSVCDFLMFLISSLGTSIWWSLLEHELVGDATWRWWWVWGKRAALMAGEEEQLMFVLGRTQRDLSLHAGSYSRPSCMPACLCVAKGTGK